MRDYAIALGSSDNYPNARGYYLNIPLLLRILEGEPDTNDVSLIVHFPSECSAVTLVLASWDHPWSGESVEVIHIQNDPVNFPFTLDTQRGPYGVKFDDLGHTIGFHRQIPLR